MNTRLPVQRDLSSDTPRKGMARFFSPMNLARYRKLIGRKILDAERNRVLKVLAKEWSAFTWECRVPSLARAASSRQRIAPRRQDS